MELHREERESWKCDLALGETYVIELFIFPNAPIRQDETRGGKRFTFFVDPDNLPLELSEK